MRDVMGSQNYWDKWVDFCEKAKQDRLDIIEKPSGNPQNRPQFVYRLSCMYYEQLLRRYSRGDPVRSLVDELGPLLDLWEKAEALGKDVWTEEQQLWRHSWEKNIDFYIISFWLVGLFLAYDVSDAMWKRLIALIGNEGEDELLDRIISSRERGRRIGTKLCHPIPYEKLLAAVNANAPSEQAELLSIFVRSWYPDLGRQPKKSLSRDTAMYERPYWYDFGNENFEGGAYFGRWCIEAIAVVKAFGIDDHLCLDLPMYPGNLLRPDQPSTHVVHSSGRDGSKANGYSTSVIGFLKRFF